MQKIPDTFCPAKWDELQINLESNFIYSCCKATPVEINDNFNSALNEQKENLLNGIKDLSCEYCWKLERNNLPSLRHFKLKNITRNFKEYLQNCDPLVVEINLGNECNFQCVYCNPKFSSRWQNDVHKKEYKLYSDKFHYAIPLNFNRKKDKIKNLLENYNKKSKMISLIGGEPFYNKLFFDIIKNLQTPLIEVTTNLSTNKNDLMKFFDLTLKFEKVKFNISLDSTGDIAEFTRFGMNYKNFQNNLEFVLENCPKNIDITIKTVCSSTTVLDLSNVKNYIVPLIETFSINWYINPCHNPKFQSFDTLKDTYKPQILEMLTELKKNNKIGGTDIVKSAILTSKFNKTLYNQLVHFYNEFASRKKIKIPFDL